MLNVEKVEGGRVALWTLDEPSTRNALSHAMMDALSEAALEASRDGALRAAVLTGAGQTFVSGGDLRELRGKNGRDDAERLSDAGWQLTSTLADLPFPVIAALPGAAIGGGAELAVACDMRVADSRARIAFKQVRMGVTTAWGTVPRLAALVGAGAASRLLFTGCELGAGDAKRIGLVDDVTEDDRAIETALAWASEIAQGSPAAIAAMKQLVRATLVAMPHVRPLERQLFAETWSGPDHRDASEAWFERRPPRWRPR